MLACTNEACKAEVFPRIDPAIIVLVTDGARALLGRQPTWPAGRYSTIAGFVEPGESLEDAVRAKCTRRPASAWTMCAITPLSRGRFRLH